MTSAPPNSRSNNSAKLINCVVIGCGPVCIVHYDSHLKTVINPVMLTISGSEPAAWLVVDYCLLNKQQG